MLDIKDCISKMENYKMGLINGFDCIPSINDRDTTILSLHEVSSILEYLRTLKEVQEVVKR